MVAASHPSMEAASEMMAMRAKRVVSRSRALMRPLRRGPGAEDQDQCAGKTEPGEGVLQVVVRRTRQVGGRDGQDAWAGVAERDQGEGGDRVQVQSLAD